MADAYLALLRQSMRSLARAPAYTTTIVALLALGTCLSAASYPIVEAVLFRGLPYRAPDELHLPLGLRSLSVREGRLWEAEAPLPVGMYQNPFELGAIRAEGPIRVTAAFVGPRFLEVLGVTPLVGGLSEDDFRSPSDPRAALISHSLWVHEFGGTPTIIGAPLDIKGSRDSRLTPLPELRVAGVLPKGFVFPAGAGKVDVLLPLSGAPAQELDPSWGRATLLIRVPPGVSLDAAGQRLGAVARAWGQLREEAPGKDVIRLQEVRAVLLPGSDKPAAAALGISALLWLLAAVSAAGVMAARNQSRFAELRLRRWLGARSADLAKLSLAEALPLAILGAALGVAAAPVLLRLALQTLPPGVITASEPDLGVRTILYTAAGTSVVVLIMGLGGLLGGGRGGALPGTSRRPGVTRRKIRTAVGCQIALSLTLVLGGVLMVQTWYNTWRVDGAFKLDDVFLVEVDLRRVVPTERPALLRILVDHVRRAGGIGAVGTFHTFFLTPTGAMGVGGFVRPAGALPGSEHVMSYSGPVFETLSIKPIVGRVPTDAEIGRGPGMIVVSEGAAARLWPDEQAVGKTLTSRQGIHTVVGVVEDRRYRGLRQASPGVIYMPASESMFDRPTLVVRAIGGLDKSMASATRAIASASTATEIVRVETIAQAVGRSIAMRSFQAWFFGAVAGSSTLIASIGIAGLVAIGVAARRKEIAIRCALGADTLGMTVSFVREYVPQVISGVLAGLLVSYWAVQAIDSLVLGSAYDLRWWAVSIVTVLAAGAAGLLVPTIRAAGIDPAPVLKMVDE